MSFLFVDEITELERGRSARGYFRIPMGMPDWPLFLLCEAVGQLASWVAMAEVDFLQRPVAALAGEVLVFAEAKPGDTVDLAVHVDGTERNAVLYGGSAATAGRSLIEMNRCVGPFLPMADFDDPDAVRARFERLCRPGGAPAPFEPVALPVLEVITRSEGSIRVGMQVPSSAPLFAEHFPRRAVYPATLLLDRQIHAARILLGGDDWNVKRASHVKIGAFVFPGEKLEFEATVMATGEGTATLSLTGYRGTTRVSRVRMEFVRGVI